MKITSATLNGCARTILDPVDVAAVHAYDGGADLDVHREGRQRRLGQAR